MKNVLFKSFLFIVFYLIGLESPSQNINSDVNLSEEEFKVSKQLFIVQSENNALEKISSFACLEKNFFQFQVKDISAIFCRGTDEGKCDNAQPATSGHAPEPRWVSPFCVFGQTTSFENRY